MLQVFKDSRPILSIYSLGYIATVELIDDMVNAYFVSGCIWMWGSNPVGLHKCPTSKPNRHSGMYFILARTAPLPHALLALGSTEIFLKS